jgi:hypothetical protein
MANNRLYIEDTETGERLAVAKSFGPPWDWRVTMEEVQAWMEGRDIASTCDCSKPTKLRFVTEADEPNETAIRAALLRELAAELDAADRVVMEIGELTARADQLEKGTPT